LIAPSLSQCSIPLSDSTRKILLLVSRGHGPGCTTVPSLVPAPLYFFSLQLVLASSFFFQQPVQRFTAPSFSTPPSYFFIFSVRFSPRVQHHFKTFSGSPSNVLLPLSRLGLFVSDSRLFPPFFPLVAGYSFPPPGSAGRSSRFPSLFQLFRAHSRNCFYSPLTHFGQHVPPFPPSEQDHPLFSFCTPSFLSSFPPQTFEQPEIPLVICVCKKVSATLPCNSFYPSQMQVSLTYLLCCYFNITRTEFPLPQTTFGLRVSFGSSFKTPFLLFLFCVTAISPAAGNRLPSYPVCF